MQAANYDTGGQGVAYNVTSVNGTANSYRSDGVDLEACTDTGCGYDIGWTATGQWFKYTVNVATARDLHGHLAAGLAQRRRPTACTSPTPPAPTCPGTSTSRPPAAGRPGPPSPSTVTLPAGQQTLTIDQDNGGWNIHHAHLRLTTPGAALP